MEVTRIKSLASVPNYENFQFDIKYGVSSQCYIQLLQAVDPYFNAVVLEESKTFEGNKEGLAKAVDWIEEKRKNIFKNLGAILDEADQEESLPETCTVNRCDAYDDTFCTTCKWNISLGPVSMCKTCALCTNVSKDEPWECNCLLPKPDGEESCPYYMPSQNN